MEVPLLRESKAFADRLCEAAQIFGENTYHLNRRINWTYRYCDAFYAREAALFCQNPTEYIEGDIDEPPIVSDVFAKRIGLRQLVSICIKVAAHWAFAIFGKLAGDRCGSELYIYRKCYVDDVELAFDPATKGVLRVVFPFPLSPVRQWRYCRYLRRQALPFRLDGNPYTLRDVMHLLRHRSVRAMMRLESRAEIRSARRILRERFSLIELSDEFNIGSLDFSRTVSRARIPIVNSAHGIGKYFPIHHYTRFNILNSKQKYYYKSEGPCKYEYFKLYASYGVQFDHNSESTASGSASINLVFLSQAIENGNPIIAAEEVKVIDFLSTFPNKSKDMFLHYKPHPNSKINQSFPGWNIIKEINAINKLENRILVSFFSTCHIDDRFKGRKYLIRSGVLHPEIAYDDQGDIFDINDFGTLLLNESFVL